MRILFLTHNYPRFPGDVSGSFLATLARGLQARGHVVRVVAPSDLGDPGPPELDGIPVDRVRYAPAAREVLAYRGTMAQAARTPRGAWDAWHLIRALREGARRALAAGTDVIHAHWWIPGGLAVPPGAPFVLTLHGTDAELLARSAAARLLARPVFRRAPVVTVVSRAAAERVRTATGREIPASCVRPMPVDLAHFAEPGAGGGGLVAVARLSPQKRLHLALEALTVAGPDLPPLTIIGEGADRARLEELTRARGLQPRVSFTGALPPAEVAARLARADVAIFPAAREGFGLAAAEALMAGVPVVACSDGGGVLDVVPAQGGGRVVPPRPEAIADAIRSLLADSAARAAAAQDGRRWRERLSPAAVAQACEGWYREALGG